MFDFSIFVLIVFFCNFRCPGRQRDVEGEDVHGDTDGQHKAHLGTAWTQVRNSLLRFLLASPHLTIIFSFPFPLGLYLIFASKFLPPSSLSPLLKLLVFRDAFIFPLSVCSPLHVSYSNSNGLISGLIPQIWHPVEQGKHCHIYKIKVTSTRVT